MNTGIECQATRRSRSWVAYIPEHGVYGHGRTLKAVRDNLAEGLTFVGVSAPVTVIPVTPGLQLLRDAEQARDAALMEAAAALAIRRATLGDIAEATGVRTRRIKELLAQRAMDSAEPDLAATGTHDTDGAPRPLHMAEQHWPQTTDTYAENAPPADSLYRIGTMASVNVRNRPPGGLRRSSAHLADGRRACCRSPHGRPLSPRLQQTAPPATGSAVVQPTYRPARISGAYQGWARRRTPDGETVSARRALQRAVCRTAPPPRNRRTGAAATTPGAAYADPIRNRQPRPLPGIGPERGGTAHHAGPSPQRAALLDWLRAHRGGHGLLRAEGPPATP